MFSLLCGCGQLQEDEEEGESSVVCLIENIVSTLLESLVALVTLDFEGLVELWTSFFEEPSVCSTDDEGTYAPTPLPSEPDVRLL